MTLRPELKKPPRDTKAKRLREMERAACFRTAAANCKSVRASAYDSESSDTGIISLAEVAEPVLENLEGAILEIPALNVSDSLSDYDEMFRFHELAPQQTSVVGWAALHRSLSRGLFSLNVLHNTLSYASYAFLREHVAEFQAGRVKSPAEEDASITRRGAAVAKRGMT